MSQGPPRVSISNDRVNVVVQDGNNVVHGNQNVYFGRVSSDRDPLALLPTASNAAFNALGKEDEPTCLPGTRVGVLEEIRAWIDGGDKKHIFWLSGWAGTGKSTIARTVAQEYYDRKLPVGSYFFSRGGGDAGNETKFVSTIARQLANKLPKFKEQLSDAFSRDEDILKRGIKYQWRDLITTPLLQLEVGSYPSPVVIVVDALDECDTEKGITQVIQLLSDIEHLNRNLLRILITSRPEVPVRDEFSRLLPGENHLILQDISTFIVEQDLSLFLKHRLVTIKPEEEVVAQLVREAAGLFIWAATACQFICEGPSPEKRLRIILRSSCSTPTTNHYINGIYVSLFQHIIRSLIWNSSYLWFWIAVACGFSYEGVVVKRSLRTLITGNTTPEDHLDAIYLTVLDSSIRPSFTAQEIRDFHSMIRDVLGSVVVLFSSLSIKSLSNLLSIPENSLTWAMRDLHALLDIPKDTKHAVRLHHPSFRDFLLNKKRCCDSYFWVDEKQAHQALLDSCLQLLESSLKQDICGVDAPGMLVADIEDSQVEESLPPEIQYACLYWIQHLQKGDVQLRDENKVHRFLKKHLLHWLEALGWMCRVSEGIRAVTILESIVVMHECPQLAAFVHDTKRFILYNRRAIEQAPLQTYCGALVFAPMKSIIRGQFKACISQWIGQLPKVENDWSALLQTFEGHSGQISSVAFSRDGKRLASGSYDETVRVWDAETGELQMTLEDISTRVYSTITSHLPFHDSPVVGKGRTYCNRVESVAFSPDGKQLASGWEKGINLWDTETGKLQRRLIDYKSRVWSIAFSQDGQQLASGSIDCTVRVWDVKTGRQRKIFKGHSSSVESVAFSHDSKLLASSSLDRTVRIWNVETGLLQQILKGYSGRANSVTFSPDGECLAVGTDSGAVYVCDTKSFEVQKTLRSHPTSVNSVAFSHDGKLLASSSLDRTARIWNVETGLLLAILEGHSDWVKSVAFSPDGKRLGSGSSDNTIRIWDIKTTPQMTTGPGSVRSLIFSQDGKRIVSGHSDNSVYVWDANTGESLKTLKAHSDAVNVVALSPDGSRLVSSSRSTVYVWETDTGTLLMTLKNHLYTVESLSFSQDGKWLASGSYGRACIWDAETGEVRQNIEYDSATFTCISFCESENRLACGLEYSGVGMVRILNAETGELQKMIGPHSNPVRSVAFSPDGKRLASASYDVKIWDVETGELQLALSIGASISQLSFSPDGCSLASDIGCIALGQPSDGYPIQQWSSYCISVDKSWITWNGSRVLWIPPEYRPVKSAIRGHTIAIGCVSGLVFRMRFDTGVFPPLGEGEVVSE